MRRLELLAPARTAEIGIAAIDCGADAVYVAGPRGGARKDAGNPIEDIGTLCSYAHKFGARVFVTFNIILRDDELDIIHADMLACQKAGADAFIIRDPRICAWKDITVPLHASTQCSIRTPERAKMFEEAGCSRLILERELTLSQIRRISEAVSCEIECFVHGALCVCYSGQCLMSEHISAGERSADRGECIQACRNLYDLEDMEGHVLVKDKALLSLKDFNLSNRISELADAGVTSFKIEGRLKGESYVRNTVRAYSLRLDEIVAQSAGTLTRASFGAIGQSFRPDLEKTFNRGYTELNLDGRKGNWASIDFPKWAGEAVGKVTSVSRCPQGIKLTFSPSGQGLELCNGDGFAFLDGRGMTGFRGDICSPGQIICRPVQGLTRGVMLYRNISTAFEKELHSAPGKRYIRAVLEVRASRSALTVRAVTEDGRTAESVTGGCDTALNPERAEAMIRGQLSKHSGIYAFSVGNVSGDGFPHLGNAALNAIRRDLAEALDSQPCRAIPMANLRSDTPDPAISTLISLGTGTREGELMRSKYCIRHELGLCPHRSPKTTAQNKPAAKGEAAPLVLVNNGRRFPLRFDCTRCEMAVMVPE